MSHRDAVLAAGLAWLYETEQPPDAVIQNHGIGVAAGARSFSFTGTGFRDFPVVVFEVANPEYVGNGRFANPLDAPREPDEVAAALERLGAVVATRWNGCAGQVSASFGLGRPAHPTLVDAVTRYRAGCPEHGTVFCGWQGSTPAERACTWYADGYAKIVRPAWPHSEESPRG